MKKLVVILVVALMVSGAAYASATNWAVYLQASTTAYGSAATNSTMGVAATASVLYYTANTGAQAETAIYLPNQTPLKDPQFYKTEKRVAPVYPQTWDIRLWCGTSYPSTTIRVSWWIPAAALSLPGGAGGMDYKLVVVSDPTGQLTVGEEIFKLSVPSGGTELWGGTQAIPMGHFDLSTTGGGKSLLMSPDSAAIASGLQLQFIATPPIPEPSGLLALASGMVGLAGFAWRRRRA